MGKNSCVWLSFLLWLLLLSSIFNWQNWSTLYLYFQEDCVCVCVCIQILFCFSVGRLVQVTYYSWKQNFLVLSWPLGLIVKSYPCSIAYIFLLFRREKRGQQQITLEEVPSVHMCQAQPFIPSVISSEPLSSCYLHFTV